MSKDTQPSIAAADAVLVVAKARTAVSFAASAEPALNPNHPNQSMPVPSRTYGMLAGSCASLAMWLWRRPSTSAPASAARPADMWTTVPPAKSSTPHLPQPALRVPCHVRERRVDEEAEQDHEEQVAREPDPLGEGPGDERRGDDRELQLEQREEQQRDGRREVRVCGARRRRRA